MESVVELRGVVKSYQGRPAVRDLTLTIRKGEFFALLGPSGCGKSTTLGLIAGFLEPTSGQIFLAGECVNGVPPHRRSVNTVFQNYALFPHMTVAENVGFGLRMKGLDREEIQRRVGEMLEAVSLAECAGRMPSQLSGGQQQRVALARPLVNRPAVLLLDEPLGALDLKLRKQMQIELTAMQRKFGITFVHVTHDQEEAMSMADRIAVMDATGRMVQVGTPQEIYQHPQNRFVAGFIGAANFFEGKVEQVCGDEILIRSGGGAVLWARAEPGITPGLRVEVSVRPERMAIETEQGDSRENRIFGEVLHASYLGASVQYVVRGPGQDILVSRPAAAEQEFHAPGERVWVRWPREITMLLRDGAGA